MRTWFNRTTDSDLKWWNQKRCTAVHFAFGIKYRVLAAFTLCCFFWFEDFSNYTSQICSHTHNNQLHRNLAFRSQTIFFFFFIQFLFPFQYSKCVKVKDRQKEKRPKYLIFVWMLFFFHFLKNLKRKSISSPCFDHWDATIE